jgi:hypothetical protein
MQRRKRHKKDVIEHEEAEGAEGNAGTRTLNSLHSVEHVRNLFDIQGLLAGGGLFPPGRMPGCTAGRDARRYDTPNGRAT